MTDVLIIGAGPSGLACALAAKRAGIPARIIEQGGVVDAIRRFPTNMTFFSTPELLEIGGYPFVSSAFRPTREEAVRYYSRVAKESKVSIIYDANVQGIERGDGKFRVASSAGSFEASNLIVATGYFDDPNPYDVPGVGLPKVSRYYTEPYRYFDREVALVGGKNSVVDAALELYRNGAHVSIIHRGPRLSDGVKYWLVPDIENRLKSGEIKGYFNSTVKEIRKDTVLLDGEHRGEIANQYLFILIGYTPRTEILQSVGVKIDRESLAPVHDPSTMQSNIPGLFVAGSLAAGRFNNKIFIENGRLHGEKIVSFLSRK
ncbi:MAG TPA: YpdA family putative bacillithiol disulfide reductase [Bacteroidota bacterium]|nr:YpdA family putative bacillithiol disulfide reductase [Bacteroidota bacterium]